MVRNMDLDIFFPFAFERRWLVVFQRVSKKIGRLMMAFSFPIEFFFAQPLLLFFPTDRSNCKQEIP